MCSRLPLKSSVPTGNKLERRLERQTGTRLWKSLDSMSESLTLLFGQKRGVIKVCFIHVDCPCNNKLTELGVRETRDRKAREQQLEMRGHGSLS